MPHTPGPYTLDSVMSEPHLHDITLANPPPGQGNPVVIASVYFDEERNECPTLAEASANAKLFASAPEMLAACEKALELVNNSRFGSGNVETLLRQAIAKATGK